MRFFFYGTLMDRDVLMRVLGRPVLPSAMKPAVLRGWRRTAVRGASYPVVVRDKAAAVEGISVDGISKPEAERLAAYEGPNYRLVQLFADFPGVGTRAVLLFVPRPGSFWTTDADWCLAAWQSTHKQKFLARLAPEGSGTAGIADRR